MTEEKIVNRGVLLGQRPEDYKAGANSPIVFVSRNPSGDWSTFIPSGENQWSNRGDSMSCVTFSALNSIETQEKFLTGFAPNYSDRWIAKMSGTTKDGNYLYSVADAIRKYGLVLEEDYPSPASYSFEEYHAEIPPDKMAELLAKGKAWLEKWKIQYEWLPVDAALLEKHLQHVPIQVVIPGHAVEEIKQTDADFTYFDTYHPYVKVRPGLPQYAFKIVLTPITSEEGNKIMYGFKKASDDTVYVLQGSRFIPVSSWDAFADMGGSSDTVITLADNEFAKLNIAQKAKFGV